MGHHSCHPGHDLGGDFHRPEDRARELRLLRLLILINFGGMLVEIIGGLLTNSLALLSDAGHMFTHLFSILVAYFGIVISARAKDTTMTFGYFRMEVLAAFFNGLTILGIVLLIVIEAFRRLTLGSPVLVREMVVVAILGLITNLVCAWLLMGTAKKDLNLRAVLIHLLSDTFSSIAILFGGWVIYKTGWNFVDVLASLIIAAIIGYWGLDLLKKSAKILLQGVPEHIDIEDVARAIQSLPAVKEIHDLHIWELTSNRYVMTGHILTENMSLAESEKILRDINIMVKEKFAIGHTTFQFESKHS